LPLFRPDNYRERDGKAADNWGKPEDLPFSKMLSGIKATVSLPDVLFPRVQFKNKGE
jgi:hypothetical protein